MNNSINSNIVVSNVNFTGFQWPRKLHFKEPAKLENVKIYKANSEAEEKETAIRKSLEWIFKKLGFGKKLRNAGEEPNNQQETVDAINQVYKDIKLKKLMETNPDEAKEQILLNSTVNTGKIIKFLNKFNKKTTQSKAEIKEECSFEMMDECFKKIFKNLN